MTTYRCPQCKTALDIPEGVPGIQCHQCGAAVLLEDLPRPRSGLGLPILSITVAIIVVVGVLFYNGTLTLGGLNGGPRAAAVTPRRFVLYELSSDDTMRVVEFITLPFSGPDGEWILLCGPTVLRGDDVLSKQWIGDSVIREYTNDDSYRGQNYLRKCAQIDPADTRYGYDMQIINAPHLHLEGAKRLISIGIDPKQLPQEIIAVAIPGDAHIESVRDYQPYMNLTMDGWNLYYFDTTKITGHVSIHIRYVPGVDAAPSLDVSAVESSR